jgi:hypothetical protein
MKKYGSITAKEAENEYGCMRLASRINELRRNGVAITAEMVAGKNRRGEATHYARYSLAEVAQ